MGAIAGVIGVVGIFSYYGNATGEEALPSVQELRTYQPATVTTVKASDGSLLGEIYDQRRYVIPLERDKSSSHYFDEEGQPLYIPLMVQNAFTSAEDANFWNHGGIDYMGIARAMARNIRAGRISQGGSTITQQVAKNFLLTNDRKFKRKIKEAILSWRIEEAHGKEHVLFLYLNEIFLGSQAYGVEAASRTFFGKHVTELSLGEAAILAGLPPRPSSWNPHKNFEQAKGRQSYVLRQMVRNGHITQAQADAAKAEDITVIARGNAFREKAPHFTEHVRRYLVEQYGEDKVLNGGLTVTTTCDPTLQNAAQQAVDKGIHRVDQRMGFRREGLTTLASQAEIDAHIAKAEETIANRWARQQDPAGRIDAPSPSVIEPGEFYEAVITEVSEKWAKVRIGAHTGIIPMKWSLWVYTPNPNRSWRSRVQDDFTSDVDEGGGILRVGDVVEVKVESLSTQDAELTKIFKGTPGQKSSLLAVRLWQDLEVETALLSIDVETGAVRAMIGGADFSTSQFNRATQAKRQVGSTFKPIVYSAALETKRITAATQFADAPLAFATSVEGFTWKPSNYGGDYLGNITLRKALALSRNTSTIRVLESVDPGMNDDVVYDYARRFGIGGPPTHTLGDDWLVSPESDTLCAWVKETPKSTICSDRFPAKKEGLSDRQHRRQLTADDNFQCRACDLSLGLGSAALTMEELVRAYEVFANGGVWREPYYVEEVRDINGDLLERHTPAPEVRIISPELAEITTWLLQGVVQGGTASIASRTLGVTLAGKTGTTNDEKDAWFIGYSPTVLTAVWVGFDDNQSLGRSSTGGRTALPIWMDYMAVASPKSKDRAFTKWGNRPGNTGGLTWVQIDEESGRRVTGGGRNYPFLPGTVPEATGATADQASIEDLTTEL